MSMGDGSFRCVACGEYIGAHCENHHCKSEFENQRQGIDRRSQEHHEHVFNEAQRLGYGFHLLHLCGD